MRVVFALLVTLVMSACTSMQVAKVDEKTGYFPTTQKATVVTSKPLDLDARKALLLIPNVEFVKGQIGNIQYFTEIMTVEDLEKRIVQSGLTDKVPSVRDRIGINNAAKHYKTFLWFRYERRGEGRSQFGQFVLTDPITLEDYFVTETALDFVWAGVNDQNNWYPMFNALIDYIKQNSKTFRR